MAASLAAPDPYGRLSRIRLPPWMLDGEALVRPGVEEARFGEPMIGELPDPLPGHAVLLAAPPERAPPEVRDVAAEGREGAAVGRRRASLVAAPKNAPAGRPKPLCS